MKYWNDTIFGNATDYYNQPVVAYYLDSGNGILDIARQIKMRIKAFSYAYRMTNNTKWVDRAYKELQVYDISLDAYRLHTHQCCRTPLGTLLAARLALITPPDGTQFTSSTLRK